jgi:hypothetical protein
MKKAGFLSFLLLAVATLLVHGSVPHHHHSTVPGAMCTTHHHGHDDVPDADNDAHDESALEDCQLSNVYVKINSNEEATQGQDVRSQPLHCGLFLCTDCSLATVATRPGLPLRLKPYLPSSFSECVARSSGWRAPPVY